MQTRLKKWNFFSSIIIQCLILFSVFPFKARHQVVLKYQAPALHMNFGGKISYRDPNRTLKHLFFNHTITISDILRPLVISTEEFGLKWAEASFEKKQKLSSSVKNCQELSERAKDELKVYPVEIIGEPDCSECHDFESVKERLIYSFSQV